MHFKLKSTNLFFASIIIFGIIRGIMLLYKFPIFLYKINLFNPNYFAVSNVSPSLGDYLINSIYVLIIVFTVFFQLKKYSFEKFNLKLISLLAIFISYLCLYLFYNSILQIYSGSQYLLDLKLSSSSIGFEFKMSAWAIFIIQSTIYLAIQYFCFLKIKSLNYTRNELVFAVIFAIILGLNLAYFLHISIYLVLAHLIYLVIVLLYNLTISLNKYHYKATIFIVISSIFCSFVATYTHYTQEGISDFIKKQQFGKSKLEENDPMGEFLIEVANEGIKNSAKLKSLLIDIPVNFDLVDIEISEHLKNWFDQYHIDVNYYGKYGNNLKFDNTKSLEKQWEFYIENGEKTLIENLYLIRSGKLDKSKKYVFRSKVNLKNNTTIDLIILFNALRNRNSEQIGKKVNGLNFEYKIFSNKSEASEKKLNSEPEDFEKKLLLDKNIFNKVLIYNDISYSAFKNIEGNTVLVYSPVPQKSDIFRTFSFLFILLILALISGLILISYFLGGNYFNESYSTKIQIYFGLVFLMPFFITLIIVFNLIGNSHFKSEINKYEEIAADIKKQILLSNKQHNLNFVNRYIWHEIIEKLANEFDVNIELYSTESHIITNSNIFTKSLKVGHYELETKILTDLDNLNENENIIEKSDTETNLYILYEKIKSKNGITLGYFSLPFYATSSFENNETNELFGSILSTFAVIFLLLLAISIFISNRLIKPLSLITNHLQNTDLKNSNLPIQIKSNDEIGLLVEGYNNMLTKIEDGKKEISANEKQTAWLDIAKQVAHEIKNPLTPMKLTLQHLEHTLAKETDVDKAKVLAKISTLLYNIDNISEIVDSFMAFAKMPLPKNVKIDLLKPIKNAIELYSNIDGISLQIDSKIKKANILGDEKVLSQIVNNLIINALQSVSKDKLPEIKISLSKVDANYLLKISDNGSGISDELSKKVFLPNFTTKSYGLGVGLSLAKWGIENMNGEIWFESKLDEGTTFFVEMPVFND